jgi:hypothetical protein
MTQQLRVVVMLVSAMDFGDILIDLQDPKRGEGLYANFRASMHTWVLFNAETCCGVLLRALGEGRPMDVLNSKGCLSNASVNAQHNND